MTTTLCKEDFPGGATVRLRERLQLIHALWQDGQVVHVMDAATRDFPLLPDVQHRARLNADFNNALYGVNCLGDGLREVEMVAYSDPALGLRVHTPQMESESRRGDVAVTSLSAPRKKKR